MKKIWLIVLLALSLFSFANGEERFFNMSHVRIDSLLRETARKDMTLTERVAFYSKFFLETPYDFKCVGDGPYALLEKYPLVNFQKTNCMALCEHVLALAISDSWDHFFNNLMKIRYQDGQIGMKTRNHYTMADWLPENKWLLRSVSKEVGGDKTKTMTRTISHKTFFKNKGIADSRYVKPDREMTVPYIPLENFHDISGNLKNGDVLALLFKNKTDIFSAHMLLVIKNNDDVIIRESSNSKMSTFDTPIEKWLKGAAKRDRYAGVAVMRINDDLNKKGKVLLPEM